MKRFLILAALIAGVLMASSPSDASAGWRRAYRRGYYAGYNGGYGYGYRGRYRRPGVVIATPGVQVQYGTAYYGNPYYGNGYYGNGYYGNGYYSAW